MPSHGGPRRDAGPQGPSARRGLRARAARGLAAGGLALVAALVAGAPAWADDAYCTGTYGTDAPKAGPPIRFGVDPEPAGSVGTGQAAAKPLDDASDLAALSVLTPTGKALVLRVNRLFWADGEDGIRRFQAIVARHTKAGFDSELQVRYHPATGDEGNIAKWTAYVRHVVDVFGADRHVVAMTITNEVNLDISENTSDGAYASAREALIKGIVAARARADAIGRDDLKLGFTYAYRWNPASDAAFWTALADGGATFRTALDYVGVDVYPGTFYPPVISPASSPGQELIKAIGTVRKCYMPKARLAASLPIWITENGYQSGATGDDAAQATALEDMVNATVAVSGTYNVTDYRWFNLRDNLTGSAGIFDTTGLLHDDYTTKPAFASFRALVAAHGATTPVACVTQVTVTLPPGTTRYVARLDGRRVPGHRSGRRLTITFRRGGERHVVVLARAASGRLATLRRSVTACRPAKASAAPTPRRPTLVTLEFDVATADQALALPLLAKHHMHGTFFVNSGFVNQPGHLTWDELRHMQAVGHEIAGQTIDHARLTRLGPAGIEHEVCDDRGRLLAQGLAVDAFAYPFGAFTSQAKRVVMACGYSSARLASGIRGGGQACVSCPYAESIPPRNRFATRMPAATRRTTKIARIIRAVAHAEAAGGGWVQILIHHVCHGCHRYAIAPEGLAGLLRWLDREPGVEVRTVSQIMDTRGPAIAITPPSGRWAVGDRMTIPVRIRAPAGVRRIRYFVDGHQIGVRSLAPRRLRWYSGGVSPGRHTVRALLEDERGNAAISSQRTFTRVNPGQTPPR